MLSLDHPPVYVLSSFRAFLPNEKHIDRVSVHDVLLMVFDGVLRFEEDGKPVEVHKGEYYVQRRGLRQTGRIPSDKPRYYYIHFIGDYTPSAHGLPMRGTIDYTPLMSMFKDLDWLQIMQASEIEKNIVFYKLLHKLSQPYAVTEARRTVEKLITAVFQDLQTPYSLDDLSRMCGYSKNYIIRLFRQETGQTPHSYITAMKLDMARRLLLESHLSIEQIAVQCGFGAYTNLYKEFGRAEGCSPLQYRNRNKG